MKSRSSALPRRIVVKVGGRILDRAEDRQRFSAAVAKRVIAGDEMVVVHGGGAQVTRAMEVAGLVPKRIDGLRITDDATAETVLRVLAGEVNSRLVATIQRALDEAHCGGPTANALGLTGADGGLLQAEVLDHRLGHVGRVTSARGGLLRSLVQSGCVPVVATVAPSRNDVESPFLNVNADDAVAPIARAFDAHAVLFLSDVPHVAIEGRRCATLEASEVNHLVANGAIFGGMIPKARAALAAATASPSALVKVASGVDCEGDVIVEACRESTGTRFKASQALEASHA